MKNITTVKEKDQAAPAAKNLKFQHQGNQALVTFCFSIPGMLK